MNCMNGENEHTKMWESRWCQERKVKRNTQHQKQVILPTASVKHLPDVLELTTCSNPFVVTQLNDVVNHFHWRFNSSFLRLFVSLILVLHLKVHDGRIILSTELNWSFEFMQMIWDAFTDCCVFRFSRRLLNCITWFYLNLLSNTSE